MDTAWQAPYHMRAGLARARGASRAALLLTHDAALVVSRQAVHGGLEPRARPGLAAAAETAGLDRRPRGRERVRLRDDVCKAVDVGLCERLFIPCTRPLPLFTRNNNTPEHWV